MEISAHFNDASIPSYKEFHVLHYTGRDLGRDTDRAGSWGSPSGCLPTCTCTNDLLHWSAIICLEVPSALLHFPPPIPFLCPKSHHHPRPLSPLPASHTRPPPSASPPLFSNTHPLPPSRKLCSPPTKTSGSLVPPPPITDSFCFSAKTPSAPPQHCFFRTSLSSPSPPTRPPPTTFSYSSPLCLLIHIISCGPSSPLSSHFRLASPVLSRKHPNSRLHRCPTSHHPALRPPSRHSPRHYNNPSPTFHASLAQPSLLLSGLAHIAQATLLLPL